MNRDWGSDVYTMYNVLSTSEHICATAMAKSEQWKWSARLR